MRRPVQMWISSYNTSNVHSLDRSYQLKPVLYHLVKLRTSRAFSFSEEEEKTRPETLPRNPRPFCKSNSYSIVSNESHRQRDSRYSCSSISTRYPLTEFRLPAFDTTLSITRLVNEYSRVKQVAWYLRHAPLSIRYTRVTRIPDYRE